MFLLSVCHLERLVQFLNNASDEYQADFTGYVINCVFASLTIYLNVRKIYVDLLLT